MQYTALNKNQREELKRAMKEAVKGFEMYDKAEWKGLPNNDAVFKCRDYEQYIQSEQKYIAEEDY